jgi:hypothetical protein
VIKATITSELLTAPTPLEIKAVKEGGNWKACPDLSGTDSSASGGASAPSDFPSQSTLPSATSVPSDTGIPSLPSLPSISGLPSIPGTGDINACSFADSASTAAITYVGLAELGQSDFAQSCVYPGSVAKATTESIKGGGSTLYSPTGSSGSTFRFTSVDGKSHLAITVVKKSDGKFYVTKVATS